MLAALVAVFTTIAIVVVLVMESLPFFPRPCRSRIS
jgi:ABC-type phosphate transport system permease subunit